MITELEAPKTKVPTNMQNLIDALEVISLVLTIQLAIRDLYRN